MKHLYISAAHLNDHDLILANTDMNVLFTISNGKVTPVYLCCIKTLSAQSSVREITGAVCIHSVLEQ